jgi:hypothetical protein
VRTPLLAALLFSALSGQGEAWAAAGQNGAEFLNILPSPRVAAMGEAGTAWPSDHLSALSINPAGLGLLHYPEASIMHNQWFEGISLQNIAYAHPVKGQGTYAFSGTLLQVKPIQGYDNSGAKSGEVTVRDVALKGVFARRLLGGSESVDDRSGLFAGAGVKYVRETLEDVSASTVLGDLGLLYGHSMRDHLFTAGLSAQSLGNGLKFDTTRDPAPSVVRFGLGWTTPVLDDPFAAVWDLRKTLNESLAWGLGLEYTVLRSLSWRLGWDQQDDSKNGLRFGLGIKLKMFNVDYALARYGDFAFTHRIALGVQFGAPISRASPRGYRAEESVDWHMSKGDQHMVDRRYYEAALEFNEVLRLDPHNKRALEKLRLVRELMERFE